jgi:hypothetical protein
VGASRKSVRFVGYPFAGAVVQPNSIGLPQQDGEGGNCPEEPADKAVAGKSHSSCPLKGTEPADPF